MSYLLPEFLTVAAVHLLAVMSPGPDFVLTSRNSLVYSRRTGVYSALGLALGILVHVTYSLVGIGVLVSQSIVLFSIIKYLGAAYLIYIGYVSLRARQDPTGSRGAPTDSSTTDLEPLGAVRLGFLTNVLNPKATLFFLALFTQVIDPLTPLFVQVLYGLEMSLMTFVWFSFVASVLSHEMVRTRFSRIHHHVERVFGVILIGFGIKIAFTGQH